MKFITDEKFAQLVAKLARKRVVWAPVTGEKDTSWQQIASAQEIATEFVNTAGSIKPLFFPQSETLFHFKNNLDGTVDLEDIPLPVRKSVAIFARPCDVRAMNIIGGVFDQDKYRDHRFADRRERLFIITLACQHPSSSCFCTSMTPDGPFCTAGSDLQFVRGDGGYLVTPVSEWGQKFVQSKAAFFSDAKADAEPQVEKLKAQSLAKFRSKLDTNEVAELMAKNFGHKYWEEKSFACISCGTCTYVCPTCHCFDIRDGKRGGKGGRYRTWDACMFPEFTKMAGGHNPRAASASRFRQRFMHKFSYFPQNSNQIACVGCGRCTRACPVAYNVTEIISDLKKSVSGESNE